MKLICMLPKKHQRSLINEVDGIYTFTDTQINFFIDKHWYIATGYLRDIIYNYPDVVAIWEGGQARLLALKSSNCDIAYHHMIRRGRRFTKEQGKDMIFLGFRNLDELRRVKPKMLITSIPIRASYYGIDLAERERRPKGGLPLDVENITLTKKQLELAIKNIKAIKEASEYGI